MRRCQKCFYAVRLHRRDHQNLCEAAWLKEEKADGTSLSRDSEGDEASLRAPRQWNETADRFLTQELGLVHHPLDRCLYLSLRAASADDPKFLQFEKDKSWWIVDGALGLHVDDF